jgi:hypothetical protein
MAELVAKLDERLEPKPAQDKATEGKPQDAPREVPGPNRDGLTVGVDLGDQWSHYCILGLEGETLGEGKWRKHRKRVAAEARVNSIISSSSEFPVGTDHSTIADGICRLMCGLIGVYSLVMSARAKSSGHRRRHG